MGALCVSTGTEVNGFATAFRHTGIEFTLIDRDSFPATNLVQNRTEFSTSEGSQYAGMEYGLRSAFDDETGTRSYHPYLLEWGADGERWQTVAEAQPDYTDHSYLVLPAGGGSTQWDVFYDYNRVATTQMQVSPRAKNLDQAVTITYPNGASVEGFDTRLRVNNAVSGWRRLRPAEVAVSNLKACDGPPMGWWDWLSSYPNDPPWCYRTATTHRQVSGSTVLGSFVVRKPGETVFPPPQNPPQPVAPRIVYNGVNQRDLQSCLASDAAACLDTVAGLAECVNARLVCNLYGPPPGGGGTAAAPAPMSDAQAASAATRTVGADPSARVDVRRATESGARDVVVVVGSGRAHSFAAGAERTYDGYRLTYDARTHHLVSGCLGTACALDR